MKRALFAVLATLGLVFSNEAAGHDISEVVNQVLPSVAYIQVEPFDLDELIKNPTDPGQLGRLRQSPVIGTGFVTEGNLVITNYHVIEYAVKNNTKIRVSFHDEEDVEHIATIVGYDKTVDVAVLRLPVKRPSVVICPISDVKPGQDIFSISNFYGIEFSVTRGIVSSVDRADPRYPYVHQVQLQLLEGSGSSGGPVFNVDGKVVSMNQSILSMLPAAMGDGPVKMLSSVAFSIRGDTLSEAIERIKAEKVVRRADLGVALEKFAPGSPVFRQIDPRNKKLRGVMVIYLDRDVKNHVLMVGDIITKVDNKTFFRPEDFLLHLDNNYKIGDYVKLQVYRRGSTLNISVPVIQAGLR